MAGYPDGITFREALAIDEAEKPAPPPPAPREVITLQDGTRLLLKADFVDRMNEYLEFSGEGLSVFSATEAKELVADVLERLLAQNRKDRI